MTWIEFNALCARRMHVYAVVNAIKWGVAYYPETYTVNCNHIQNYKIRPGYMTRLDALRAGLRAVVIERETETGGRRE